MVVVVVTRNEKGIVDENRRKMGRGKKKKKK